MWISYKRLPFDYTSLLIDTVIMSGFVPADGSDLYSVVDLSKKSKNRPTNKEYESRDVEPGIPMYAVVDKSSKKVKKENDVGKEEKIIESSISAAKVEESEMNTKNPKHGDRKYNVLWLALILSIAAIALFVVLIIMQIVAFVKIAALESSQGSNNPTMVNPLIQNLDEFVKIFSQNLTSISVKFEERINTYDYAVRNIPSSCADILFHTPSSPSGYYIVRSSTGQLTSVYCDMTRTCGNITGGWMRVAQLDVDNCPTGLKSQSFNGIKTCIRSEEMPGCTSVPYNSFDIQYSKVCGQIRGYGVGTVDGLFGVGRLQGTSITEDYLDGTSIASSENHIWSFVSGRCECNSNNRPSFIGKDRTCDDNSPKCSESVLCGSVLWNTNECGETTSFFYKQLSNNITTDINVKVCRDEPRNNEDIAITIIELYVQ